MYAVAFGAGALLTAAIAAGGYYSFLKGLRASPEPDRHDGAIEALQAELAGLRQQIEELRQQVGDLRAAPVPEAVVPEPEPDPAAEAEDPRDLDLRGAEVTDADLERLPAFAGMRSLSLRETKVMGPGLRYLPASLESLDLTDTKVTQDALIRLPWLPSLVSLDLNRLLLDDGVVEALGRIASLRKIELDGTGITDEGVRRLLELNPALERLELRGTPTTIPGLRKLAEAHPELTIVRQ